MTGDFLSCGFELNIAVNIISFYFMIIENKFENKYLDIFKTKNAYPDLAKTNCFSADKMSPSCKKTLPKADCKDLKCLESLSLDMRTSKTSIAKL